MKEEVVIPQGGHFKEREKKMRKSSLSPLLLTADKTTFIKQVLSFLEERREKIHSVILIGSTVFGFDEEGSDIDIVVICKKDHDEEVSNILHKRMMSEEFKVQYSIYEPTHVERIFTIGSPFANSIRNGVVLKDDGYLKGLLTNKEFPLKPTREYYLEALKDIVGLRYYFPIIDIEQEIKEDHGPEGICIKIGKCQGHAPGDILATGIFRMLYITLSYRGYRLLSKADVTKYAGEIYGQKTSDVLNKCIELLRQDRWGVTVEEYRLLKPFAVKLFRECLRIVDLRNNGDMLKELRDSARAARLISRKRVEERVNAE
ncbi:MAG: nucleotidyltransferase domain-containing protein [Deltaproteobacteria bacterium]|nr:nucleotidyltransferase domain-containing protein [Deltaproteobacteria bacterium]